MIGEDVLNKLKNEVDECRTRAIVKYGSGAAVCPTVSIRNTGKAGALCYINKWDDYELVFNSYAVEHEWDVVVQELIPHELAHAIQHKMYLNDTHDAAWKRTCLGLGGNGCMYHSLKLPYKSPVKRYMYRTSSGTTELLSPRMHKIIQSGEDRYYPDGAVVDRYGFVKMVEVAY